MRQQIDITSAIDPVWSVRLSKDQEDEKIIITFMDDEFSSACLIVNFDDLKKAMDKLSL